MSVNLQEASADSFFLLSFSFSLLCILTFPMASGCPLPKGCSMLKKLNASSANGYFLHLKDSLRDSTDNIISEGLLT